jgi:hypothetical protein
VKVLRAICGGKYCLVETTDISGLFRLNFPVEMGRKANYYLRTFDLSNVLFAPLRRSGLCNPQLSPTEGGSE